MHPERREKLDSVRVDRLGRHPLSVKIYGEPNPPEELMSSIERHGLLQPLIVNVYGHGYQLLAGNTRAEAWYRLWQQKRIKSAWMPCRILHLAPLEAERLVIESNRQREKTAGQKARESAELARIESELAAERMLRGKDNPRRSRRLRSGKTVDIVAEKTGQSNRTVEKQIAIVTKADEGDPVAQEALSKLDRNETSVTAAYREVAPFRRTPEKPRMSDLLRSVRNLECLAETLPGLLADSADKQERSAAIERMRRAIGTLSEAAGTLKKGHLAA